MDPLAAGDTAPSFSREDQHGATVRLSDFKGRKLLLFFYPRADTPGCTRQSCSVRDARSELSALGVDVLGISPDAPGRQRKFDDKYALGFPLLADEGHAVASAYGAWGGKSIFGKFTRGIIRSSFLIDERGKVVEAWYKVSPEETVPLAQEALRLRAASAELISGRGHES